MLNILKKVIVRTGTFNILEKVVVRTETYC